MYQEKVVNKHISPFGLRMPPDLHGWVKEQAQQAGRSMNNWLVQVVRERRAAESKRAEVIDGLVDEARQLHGDQAAEQLRAELEGEK